jgi:uncharacterized C2H2 Zn-finger protein
MQLAMQSKGDDGQFMDTIDHFDNSPVEDLVIAEITEGNEDISQTHRSINDETIWNKSDNLEQVNINLAIKNDEKFLNINDYRDVGSTNEINADITKMDAETVSGQIIDDRGDFQKDNLHPERLKTEEPIAEVWKLADNEMELQESNTTDNMCIEETKDSNIDYVHGQIPDASEKAIVSESVEKRPNISKKASSGTVKGYTRFECQCGKSFSWKKDLNTHKKTHDTKFEALLTCPDCGKKFSTKQMLTLHVKCVHQGYYYECPICNKEMKSLAKMFAHIKKNHSGSGVKPVEKCD